MNPAEEEGERLTYEQRVIHEFEAAFMNVVLSATPWGYLVVLTTLCATYFEKGPPLFKTAVVSALGAYFLDLATGILAAKVVRGEKITSQKLLRGVIKGAVYLFLYLSCILIDATTGGGGYGMQTTALGLLAITEMKSNWENLTALLLHLGIELDLSALKRRQEEGDRKGGNQE